MDDNRQLPPPGRNHPPPPRLMTSSNSPQSRPIAPYQQPSLPSIRQLHPYLPPSGMAQHLPPADVSAYTYPLPSYPGPSEIPPPPPPSQPSQHSLYGRSEMHDSEPEEVEQQGPAKKKRRRQALSCNGKIYFPSLQNTLLIVIDTNLCLSCLSYCCFYPRHAVKRVQKA